MKRLILLLIITGTTQLSFGQVFSVASDKLNIIYIGVDNPLTLTVENTDCKDLIVKASKGTIKGDSCKFTFRFDDASQVGSKTQISISKRKGNKLIEIGKAEFRLKNIQNPRALVGGSYGGQMHSNLLKIQTFIKLNYDGFDFGVSRHVDSFVLSIIRGDSCLYTNIENIGSNFSTEVRDALASIKKGDTVIFKIIICKELHRAMQDIEPVIFYILD